MPQKIEASAFAFLTGTLDFSYDFISPLLGIFLNNSLIYPAISNSNID